MSVQSNVKMLGAAVNRVGIDTEHMALGRINKESLLKAREILLEIRYFTQFQSKTFQNYHS